MLFEIIREALRSLKANPLRAGLAMLGMVIGVGSVVLMLGIGRGTQATVENSISSLGSNLLIILPGATSQGGVRLSSGSAQTLTFGDMQAIGQLPSVSAVAATHSGNAQIVRGALNWATGIVGTTSGYFTVRDWTLAEGRPLDEGDIRSALPVAVIGQTVADNLFGDDDPIGQSIQIKGLPFTVVGLFSPKGQSLDGRDQDDTVIVPITVAQRKLFGNPIPGTVRQISVQAASAAQMKLAEKDITELLRTRHRVQDKAENDFTVRNLTAIAESAAGAAKATSLMLGAIASISLIVGGIGIMNIMLVSVTERTREIGLRKAIGARTQDILLQFLFEALVLCVVGGLTGIALGLGLAWVIATSADMTIVITVPSMVMAFLAAAGTGIFFGWTPARRAAKLNPAEALRSD